MKRVKGLFEEKVIERPYKISHKKSAITRYSTNELCYCWARNADQWQISQKVMHRVEPKKIGLAIININKIINDNAKDDTSRINDKFPHQHGNLKGRID